MKRNLLIMVVLLISLATISSKGAEPIFYLPLDGDPNAKISTGNGEAFIKGAPKYEDAKVDEGAVLSGADCLSFETENNVNPEVGTIMFWVKLSKDSTKLTSQEEFFSMYIDGNNRMRLHLDPNDFGIHWFYKIVGQSGIAKKANIEWKEDEWHRVIATWARDKSLILYLDDEKITGAQSKILDPLPELFYVGSYRGTGSFLQGTIDEFYIFDEYDVTKEPQAPVEPVGKLATSWGEIKDRY